MAELRTGTLVRLPDGAGPPYTVYLNGVKQSEGTDYAVEEAGLRFLRPLSVGKAEGLWQKLVMSTAGVGYYGQGDAVDVDFRRADGSTAAVSGLRVEPDG